MGNSHKGIANSEHADQHGGTDKTRDAAAEETLVISRQDAASYINDMAYEMKALAEKARLSFLTYLLELVIEESASQKRGRL